MTGGFVDWKDQICNIAVSTSCSSLNAIFYCSSCRSLDKEWKIYNDGHVNVISILVIKSCNYAFHDLVNQDLHYLEFCMKNISQLLILFNINRIILFLSYWTAYVERIKSWYYYWHVILILNKCFLYAWIKLLIQIYLNIDHSSYLKDEEAKEHLH